MSFDYSTFDSCMRQGADDIRNKYVGLSVLAEVGKDAFNTERIHGKCIDVQADTGFWDAIVYIVEGPDGKKYTSPAYYSQQWDYPEIEEWEIENWDWCNKNVLCGFDHSNGECKYISSRHIKTQSQLENGLLVVLETGEMYLCTDQKKRSK